MPVNEYAFTPQSETFYVLFVGHTFIDINHFFFRYTDTTCENMIFILCYLEKVTNRPNGMLGNRQKGVRLLKQFKVPVSSSLSSIIKWNVKWFILILPFSSHFTDLSEVLSLLLLFLFMETGTTAVEESSQEREFLAELSMQREGAKARL